MMLMMMMMRMMIPNRNGHQCWKRDAGEVNGFIPRWCSGISIGIDSGIDSSISISIKIHSSSSISISISITFDIFPHIKEDIC